jgi:PKD repeat protein
MWCKFPEGPATSTVSLKATDSLGVFATITYEVTINNVAPRITGRPVLDTSVVDENGSVTLSGSFTDPGLLDPHTVKINWGDGSSPSTLSLQPAVGTFSVTHQYLDDDPTGTTSDIWPLTIKVSDDDGGSDLAITTVIINNVAPVASMNVLGTVVLGGGPPILPAYDSVAAVGSFTDLGTKDTHNSTINWGDGSLLAAQLSASHAYVTPGIYTITLTVTDDDKGVGATTSQVKVVSAQEAFLIARDALLQLSNEGNLNQGAREAINRALDDLRGQAGGQASNGASDLLAKGNNNAALEKIKHALSELDRASPITTNPDLAQIKLLLALTARSVAVEAITKASAVGPRQNELQKILEAKALVSEGDALLSNQSFWGAAEKYQAGARKV